MNACIKVNKVLLEQITWHENETTCEHTGKFELDEKKERT